MPEFTSEMTVRKVGWMVTIGNWTVTIGTVQVTLQPEMVLNRALRVLSSSVMPPRTKRPRISPATSLAVSSTTRPTYVEASRPITTATTRHFTSRKFIDAPISDASKAGIQHM